MTEEMMSTKQVAQYLGIHEKQVYALIKSKRIPSTRVTGKWIFPRKLIDAWIESTAQKEKGFAQAKQKSKRIEGALLASGSNDPILDMLQTYLKRSYPEFYIFSANTGSTEVFTALRVKEVRPRNIGISLVKGFQYNVPFLSTYLPDVKAVVVNLFYRDLGFLVAPRNPFHIKGFEDLTQKGVRFINRQKGAGTRVLLDHHLKKLKLSPARV